MVFAHGYGCDQHMWRYVTPAFDDFRVVCFDHVGAGGSDLSAYDPDRYATLDGYADDVLEICDELDLQRRRLRRALGRRAMIGVLAANREPERFARLVLVGPSPRYLDDDGYVGGFARADIEELLDSLDSNYLGLVAGDGAGDHGQRGSARARGGADRQLLPHRPRRSPSASPGPRSCPTTAPTWPASRRRPWCCSAASDAIAPEVVGRVRPRPRSPAASSSCSTPRVTARTSARRRRPSTRSPSFVAAMSRRRPSDDGDAFFDDAPAGCSSTTPDGDDREVNDTFAAMTGCAADDLVGRRTFASLLSTGGRIYVETHFAPMLLDERRGARRSPSSS